MRPKRSLIRSDRIARNLLWLLVLMLLACAVLLIHSCHGQNGAATVARLELEILISDRFQSERGLPAAIISCSFTGGRLICIVSSGRRFFGTGSILTARPISADS